MTITRVVDRAIADLSGFAVSRQNDVARGAETPALAGLLVEKYAAGMAAALRCLDDIAPADLKPFQQAADSLVAEIDPSATENRKARWAARPAALTCEMSKLSKESQKGAAEEK